MGRTWRWGVVAGLGLAAGAAGEAPVRMTAEEVARVVAEAPAPPELGLDLPLRLVDFIDCTQPPGPRAMVDRGTSRVVEGPAGRYRVTAPHRHAFFAYRWRRAARDRPHVIAIEYPDDARRDICFLTHESLISGRSNLDWSLETGVYTGNPYPLSNRMQIHTMFVWPADEWPVVMVGNWIRAGAPAAASRIWVFEVEGGELPALEVRDPAPETPRLIGNLYNWSIVPARGIFGLADRDAAIEHLLDYHAYLGHNVLSWPVVANNDWCFSAVIPAWDGSGIKTDYTVTLRDLLTACDRRGMRFIAGFNTGRRFQIGGEGLTAEKREAYGAGVRRGFEQFVERDGRHPSLYGIAMDTQDLSPRYGDAALDTFREIWDGDLSAFAAFIHGLKPDLRVFHFLGSPHIHAEYFPDTGAVFARWEASQTDWPEHLAEEVRRQWVGWGRDPAALNAARGLTTILNYQVDDHVAFRVHGGQNPRSMVYHDLEASSARAALIDTRAAMVWNTFFEAWLGLQADPDGGFWYRKEWVAPDFGPAAPHALAGWARAMEHRDRDLLLAGAWNRKGGGAEAAMRRFARAYRALPPTELEDLAAGGDTPVRFRTGVWEGRRVVAALNPTPFEAEITLLAAGAEEAVRIEPFGLHTASFDGEDPVAVSGVASADYRAWIDARHDRLARLIEEVRALDPEAAPAAYARHLARAEALRAAGQWRALDEHLGEAPAEELALRRRILRPPRTTVPRTGAPPLNGDLDAWPAEAATIEAGAEHLASHMFFPASWTGPGDLSARVRLAHDGERLYLGIRVRDDVMTEKDDAVLLLSPARYRQWAPQRLNYETRLPLRLPREEAEAVTASAEHGLRATARRLDDGYVIEAVFDLAALGLAPGGTIGWSLHISDDDGTPDLTRAGWARKQVLVIPHDPTFTYWSDPRSAGELVLE